MFRGKKGRGAPEFQSFLQASTENIKDDMPAQYRKKNQNPVLFSQHFQAPAPKTKPPHRPESNDGGLASFLVVFLLFGVFIILIAFLGDYGIFAFQDLQQKKQKLVAEIQTLKNKEQALLEEIHALKNNPEYIEVLARKELGLVRPDEVIFFLPKSPPASAEKQE